MNCTVIGVTVETDGLTEEQLQEAKIFSGKNAGICYQKEGYFGTSVSDPVQAEKRFPKVVSTNHHSIADHVRIEVILEDVSKMLAIVLNSLQDYSTSEKSGRYTVMTGNSEKEKDLYTKWLGIFKKRILEVEPNIDDEMLMNLMAKKGHEDVIILNGQLSNDNMADFDDVHINLLKECKADVSLPSTKLAQENARYVLSVFTRSTTLGYSTSLRQWNYIYDWCKKYTDRFCWHHSTKDGELSLVYWGTTNEVSFFELELYKDFVDLMRFIKSNLYIEELRDSKNRCFEFLTSLSGDINHPMLKYHIIEADMNMGRDDTQYSEDDYLGVTYSVSYPASFVHIAQAERHRTLKYFMQFNPYCDFPEFYVPECIRGTDLEKEWLSDLDSVKALVPQATMVGIIETGHISDFVLKCKERLCGRAQLEIMKQTKRTAERFIDEVENGNPSNVLISYVDKFRNKDGSVLTKCMMLGGCKERCRFGSNLSDVFTRVI